MAQSGKVVQKRTKKEMAVHPNANQVIEKTKQFLQLFMCETLVKRILSLVLIVAGVSNERVTELTGLCDRSVRALKKAVEAGNIESLFVVRGGGRKSKLAYVEGAIIDEINSNNYHSRQQIADMIHEKFGINISLQAIGNLLKKTGLNA